jgi:2-oxoisovalerate dehydrogenase E2 component (dihydrolipoyl transacylase)
MGRYIVKVPDIGEGTTEAEIVKWHVAPGQEIREEDPLVDVMTDKATVEIPAPIAGTVVAIEGEVGEKRPVGSQLVTLDVAGAGNVAEAAKPAVARSPKTAAQPPQPLAPTLSPPAGRGSRDAAAVGEDRAPQRRVMARRSFPSPALRERVLSAAKRVRALSTRAGPHPPIAPRWAPPSPAMREKGVVAQ